MKKTSSILRDELPEFADGQPSELVKETASPKTARRPLSPTEYLELAQASIKRGQQEGRAERIAEQQREQEASRKAARVQLALQGLEDALPEEYRGYMTAVPACNAGTAAAYKLVNQLKPGRSIHLWGEPGVQKTHLVVWGAAQLIKRYGVRVKYLNERIIDKLAYQFDDPPAFATEEVILLDDIDKVRTDPRPSKLVPRILERPYFGKSLLTTAQRSAGDVAARYETDPQNLSALLSRLYYLCEAEVTGPDFRPVDAARRWAD